MYCLKIRINPIASVNPRLAVGVTMIVMEDVVGDLAEEDVCRWSEQDWIEDISEILPMR